MAVDTATLLVVLLLAVAVAATMEREEMYLAVTLMAVRLPLDFEETRYLAEVEDSL